MTDTNEIYEYDAKFLYDMANAIVDQMDENKPVAKDEIGGDKENDSFEIDTKKLDAEQREFCAVMADPQNLSKLDDAQIKQLYKELKVKFYADKDDKKYFKKVNKNVKAMIKSDKKRTNLRYIQKAGKYAAIAGIVLTPIQMIREGYRPYFPTAIEDIKPIFDYNITRLHEYAPNTEAVMIAAGLGVAVYAGAKTVIKLQDLKTLRRITCKVLAEELDINDVIRLKKAVNEMGINDVKEFYPLAELCEAAKPQQQQRVEVNNQEKEVKARKIEHKAKDDDEMTR